MTKPATLFVSHGSPLHALDEHGAGRAWRALADSLPKPRAVLVVSAHWETTRPMLTAAGRLETIHDFGGFPPELYRLRYEPAGAPDVAAEAAALLRSAGFEAALDGQRGIDHGAWVPLRWMYPAADVPVVQLSVQPRLDPGHHLALGQALAPLVTRDVLVIGSGHVTHNLRDWFTLRDTGPVPTYVPQFADWLAAQLLARDEAALLDYRARAPSAARAHPTEEHFQPLFVAWGAAGPGAQAERVAMPIEGNALAMDAYRFRSA
jgi:4,5-DOPA dioxygenase extradiol